MSNSISNILSIHSVTMFSGLKGWLLWKQTNKQNNKKLPSKSSQVNEEKKQIQRLLQYCILSL